MTVALKGLKMAKAIALISGGLDSLLAAKVVQEQGIDVDGVCFIMSFASKDVEGFKQKVYDTSEKAGIPVRMVDISDEFLGMLTNPKHGYGSNINPCIDCKIMMLTHAKRMMLDEKFDFIITGEVLGERPMSQNRQSLNKIKKCSDLEGYLLRPLSAKLLEETIPESEGILDRNLLCDMSGRSRKPQFALAEKYGITEYFAPAGGCLLTDPGFSKRLMDLMKHSEKLEVDDIKILKCGRHFRIDEKTKIVVGRDEQDNDMVEAETVKEDIALRLVEFASPFVVLKGENSESNIKMAAELCAGHTKFKNDESVEVEYGCDGNFDKKIQVKPTERETIEEMRI